ncbi:MAG: homocysteine S-methyltransferase family protein [Anaerovoracaceae bacterium]|nr:homocysteine S-methyltransferase family protein [Anaerovoracaceae bacterium]
MPAENINNNTETVTSGNFVRSDRHREFMEELLKNDFTFLDGAMGTMLQAAGLKLGERPEILSITEPDIVSGIHKKYIDSGSDIVYSNTFSANAYKLEGTGRSVEEVVSAAVACARGAAADAPDGRKVYTALDIGPIGEMLEPYGTLTFEKAYDMFKEMIVAGEKAGADLVVFETMTDLYEVRAAVLAALENSDLPIFVTMTFEKSGRTFTGTCVESMACVLESLGVDAVGINCSLGPAEIYPLAERLSAATSLPLIIKANAGLPDPQTGDYDIGADEFADTMIDYIKLGVRFIGGCCGTDPEYIRQVIDRYTGRKAVRSREVRKASRICTPTQVVEIDQVRVIGERINPTGKKRFKQALRENDLNYVLNQGIQQMEAGADILDVNVGLPGIDEPDMMVRVVKALQPVVDIPLQLDSSNDEAIERGLRVCNGKPIVNSVNGDPEVLHRRLPIIKKYGAAVLGLALDEGGIPETAEDRFKIACRIIDTAVGYGIPKEDVFIDCLTLTVSAQQAQAVETLKAITMVRQQLGAHTVLGVSNISFGLPYRELINHTFLTMAMDHGLDLPIINPNVETMMNAVRAFNVLTNVDKDSTEYIEHYADYQPPEKAKAAAPSADKKAESSDSSADGSGVIVPDDGAELFHAVDTGLKEDTGACIHALLESHDEMELINLYLIPALDRVGWNFEKGKIFLPQLLNSAAAASEGFEIIKTRLAKQGNSGVSKGKIILATVKGDIHDIGKNIVKIILENYGYQTIDLGRDVPPETVVETMLKEDVKLVGLSALMTTTLDSMEETIRQIRESGHECSVMVGGAVLTADYAEKIGADYYAEDAKASVDIAKKVLG